MSAHTVFSLETKSLLPSRKKWIGSSFDYDFVLLCSMLPEPLLSFHFLILMLHIEEI